jgi:hypothetical protein
LIPVVPCVGTYRSQNQKMMLVEPRWFGNAQYAASLPPLYLIL